MYAPFEVDLYGEGSDSRCKGVCPSSVKVGLVGLDAPLGTSVASTLSQHGVPSLGGVHDCAMVVVKGRLDDIDFAGGEGGGAVGKMTREGGGEVAE